MKKSLVLVLLVSLLLISCQGIGFSGGTEGESALNDLPYPRPEPDCTGNLKRDFTPFENVLDSYTPEQIAARDGLISGKTIPELQNLMQKSIRSVFLTLDRCRYIAKKQTPNKIKQQCSKSPLLLHAWCRSGAVMGRLSTKAWT